MNKYQFALLRYVHNVASEEFVNIGIVMWLPEEQRFIYRITERYARLSAFFEGFSGTKYRHMVRELQAHFRAAYKQEVGSRVQTINDLLPQLMLVESGCFQWSAPMAGLAPDPNQRLEKLFADLIVRHEPHYERPRRDEGVILHDLVNRLRQHGIEEKLRKDVEIKSNKYDYKFKLGWQNGQPQVMEPISFDYVNKEEIIEKANKWVGRLYNLQEAGDFQMTGIVAPPQRHELSTAFRQALDILSEAPKVRTLVREDQIEGFVPEIEKDLAAHE